MEIKYILMLRYLKFIIIMILYSYNINTVNILVVINIIKFNKIMILLLY